MLNLARAGFKEPGGLKRKPPDKNRKREVKVYDALLPVASPFLRRESHLAHNFL